ELTPEELERDDDLRIEAVSAASAGVSHDELLYGRERALLERMTELAESSRHLPDARINELAKWIRANCFEHGKWTNRRVLIFT
ncbi:hypothetical protein, partial [Klebsiella pneumoniae]|uniref:hypothetical protein n=1 Tax=Klebsiella pneumoniae TaxID=573 RepID=UPI0025A23976